MLPRDRYRISHHVWLWCVFRAGSKTYQICWLSFKWLQLASAQAFKKKKRKKKKYGCMWFSLKELKQTQILLPSQNKCRWGGWRDLHRPGLLWMKIFVSLCLQIPSSWCCVAKLEGRNSGFVLIPVLLLHGKDGCQMPGVKDVCHRFVNSAAATCGGILSHLGQLFWS